MESDSDNADEQTYAFVELAESKRRVKEILEKFKAAKKKKIEEEEKASEGVIMSKEELVDQIGRNQKATKILLTMLPSFDKADMKRLARASEPI